MLGSVRQPWRQLQARSLDVMRLKLKRQFRLEIELSGVPQKAIAIEGGLDESQMSRMLSDACLDSIRAHELPFVTREIGPGLMEWLAEQCGGVYTHAQDYQRCYQVGHALIGMLAHESGTLVQGLVGDFADGIWQNEEKAQRIPGLRRVAQIVDALLREAEASPEGSGHE